MFKFLEIQSYDTGSVQFDIDIAFINSLSYNLYEIDSKFVPITGIDIKTVNNINVSIYSNKLYCSFSPSQTSLVEYYGLIVTLNSTEKLPTQKREFDIVFKIRDFIK